MQVVALGVAENVIIILLAECGHLVLCHRRRPGVLTQVSQQGLPNLIRQQLMQFEQEVAKNYINKFTT